MNRIMGRTNANFCVVSSYDTWSLTMKYLSPSEREIASCINKSIQKLTIECLIWSHPSSYEEPHCDHSDEECFYAAKRGNVALISAMTTKTPLSIIQDYLYPNPLTNSDIMTLATYLGGGIRFVDRISKDKIYFNTLGQTEPLNYRPLSNYSVTVLWRDSARAGSKKVLDYLLHARYLAVVKHDQRALGWALFDAVCKGHLNIVKLLICKPWGSHIIKHDIERSILEAHRINHLEIATVLTGLLFEKLSLQRG